tara:strand:- start:559 stop:873 length:315 start_codon:yes stop_codon:yes gene_type:complete
MAQMKAKDQLEAILSRLTNEQGEFTNDYKRGLGDAIEYALGRKELNLEPSLTVDKLFSLMIPIVEAMPDTRADDIADDLQWLQELHNKVSASRIKSLNGRNELS